MLPKRPDWTHTDWTLIDWTHTDWTHTDWTHTDWTHTDWTHTPAGAKHLRDAHTDRRQTLTGRTM